MPHESDLHSTMQPLIALNQFSISRNARELLSLDKLQLSAGEHLAIVGPSGSGKTSMLLALAGKLPHIGSMRLSDAITPIAYVAQLHQFKTRAGTNDMYYQQRYHSQDNDDAQTAAEWIGANHKLSNDLVPGLEQLLAKPLLQLSNGEHRKVQLAKALTAAPKLLLLDQPFIGLDPASRLWLHDQLNALAASGVHIILTTSQAEIPSCVTHVLQLGNSLNARVLDRQQMDEVIEDHNKKKYDTTGLFATTYPGLSTGEEVIRLNSVTVRYADKTVLSNINWVVREGERWLVHGPNGAGKSTLLSLLTADHPQAYANKVVLFGKQRGSGESIWDIKRRIGFVAPEMQMYFQQTATCFETVASGLFDTIGLFRTLHENDVHRVNKWLQAFGFHLQANKQFSSLSNGEQRLVLLLRALIKNPPLLVLDEPCQGLDAEQTRMFLRLVDEVVLAANKTLVFVTHYQQERPECINRALVLNNGNADVLMC